LGPDPFLILRQGFEILRAGVTSNNLKEVIKEPTKEAKAAGTRRLIMIILITKNVDGGLSR
jgi:hypothetical protein